MSEKGRKEGGLNYHMRGNINPTPSVDLWIKYQKQEMLTRKQKMVQKNRGMYDVDKSRVGGAIFKYSKNIGTSAKHEWLYAHRFLPPLPLESHLFCSISPVWV